MSAPAPVRPPKMGVVAGFLVVLLTALTVGVVREYSHEAASVAQGQQLFEATADKPMLLRGRLAGHDEDLPVAATRCANCHVAGPAAKGAQILVQDSNRFGPALNAAWLTQAQSRRGGPPSVYSVQAFCKLLRDGIDPAWVMVNQTMPHYAVTDAQCDQIWAYVNRRMP